VIRNGSSSYHHPVDLHFKGEKFGYEGSGGKVRRLGYQVKAKVAFLEREQGVDLHVSTLHCFKY
jgi:hypothetical protein